MGSSNSNGRFVFPEHYIVGPGLTVGLPNLPGQIAAFLKWQSGGSLLIAGTTLVCDNVIYGSSFVVDHNYLVGTDETVSFIDFVGGLTLSTTGATVSFYVIRELNFIPEP